MAYEYITTEYQSFILQFIRTCFHLDIYVYKLRNFKLIVKNKATGTSHEVYYIQHSLALSDFVARCQ